MVINMESTITIGDLLQISEYGICFENTVRITCVFNVF